MPISRRVGLRCAQHVDPAHLHPARVAPRSPATIETSEVLPAPLGPSSPRIVPGSTRSDTPASATVAP